MSDYAFPVPPSGWSVQPFGPDGAIYRQVHHGPTSVICTVADREDSREWLHVSIAHRSRLPTWEELRWAKDYFIGPGRYACIVFPPLDCYVNIHPNALHLWSPLTGDWPLPEFSGEIAPGVRSI